MNKTKKEKQTKEKRDNNEANDTLICIKQSERTKTNNHITTKKKLRKQNRQTWQKWRHKQEDRRNNETNNKSKQGRKTRRHKWNWTHTKEKSSPTKHKKRWNLTDWIVRESQATASPQDDSNWLVPRNPQGRDGHTIKQTRCTTSHKRTNTNYDRQTTQTYKQVKLT